MKRLLHENWPLVAVVALATILALQIPRKALFFEPVAARPPEPFASFVVYDAAAYEAVVQKVRMSWQMRGAARPAFESRVDALDLSEDAAPRPPLGLPRAFSVPWTSDPPPPARASLLPPSLADRAPLVPVSAPPDDTAEARRIRADLLALPAALGADGRSEKISDP